MTNGEQQPAIDLDRLHRDLAEAKERVRDLEQLIILAERWYGQRQQAPLEAAESTPPAQTSEPQTVHAPDPRSLGPLANLGAREAAVQLLKTTAGTVWKVDDATREMLRLGWRTNSPAPNTVVRSAMMRDHRIERVEAGRFRYREPSEPVTEASRQEDGAPLELPEVHRSEEVNNDQEMNRATLALTGGSQQS